MILVNQLTQGVCGSSTSENSPFTMSSHFRIQNPRIWCRDYFELMKLNTITKPCAFGTAVDLNVAFDVIPVDLFGNDLEMTLKICNIRKFFLYHQDLKWQETSYQSNVRCWSDMSPSLESSLLISITQVYWHNRCAKMCEDVSIVGWHALRLPSYVYDTPLGFESYDGTSSFFTAISMGSH